MVGFDVPHVTNDMILRFMDVDLSLLPGIAAGSKGRIGSNTRVPIGLAVSSAAGIPLVKGGNTDWEGVSSYFHLFTCPLCSFSHPR